MPKAAPGKAVAPSKPWSGWFQSAHQVAGAAWALFSTLATSRRLSQGVPPASRRSRAMSSKALRAVSWLLPSAAVVRLAWLLPTNMLPATNTTIRPSVSPTISSIRLTP